MSLNIQLQDAFGYSLRINQRQQKVKEGFLHLECLSQNKNQDC